MAGNPVGRGLRIGDLRDGLAQSGGKVELGVIAPVGNRDTGRVIGLDLQELAVLLDRGRGGASAS